MEGARSQSFLDHTSDKSAVDTILVREREIVVSAVLISEVV